MSAGHAERLLLADGDAEEAKRYREVAEAVAELRQRAVDECFDGAAEVRQDALEKLSEAKRELSYEHGRRPACAQTELAVD